MTYTSAKLILGDHLKFLASIFWAPGPSLGHPWTLESRYMIKEREGSESTVGIRNPNMFGFRIMASCSDREWFGFRAMAQKSNEKNGK